MEQVLIDRKTGGGAYGDVIDAAEWLAQNRFASATLALCEMARQSPLFHETLARLKENGKQAPNESQSQAN